MTNADMAWLFDEFGYQGHYIFERLIEIMAKEFDVENPGMNKFSYRWLVSKMVSKVNHSRDNREKKKFKNILKSGKKRKIIFYEFKGDEIILYYPKLKDLADEYTQKILKKRAQEKDENVGTNSRYGVGTPSNSSSNNTNTKLDTIKDEEEKREKDRDSKFGHDTDFDESYARLKREKDIK